MSTVVQPPTDPAPGLRPPGAAAFEQIIRRHNATLYRVARTYARDEDEAEDVVQETFVRAYRHIAEFRGAAALRTWLTRIAINEALRRRRADGSATRAGGDIAVLADIGVGKGMFATSPGGARHADTPESAAARAEYRAILERAIDALPPAFRAVFILRAVEDFSIEDTAACLDISVDTVKSRYHRARRRLRRTLDAELAAALTEVFPFGGRRCDRVVAGVFARLAIAP